MIIQLNAITYNRQAVNRQAVAVRCTISSCLFCLCLMASGCGDPIWLPRAHKIDVQQGNLITQRQVEAVKAGMSRQDVAGLLGVPIATSAFHTDRWDYAYTRSPAGHLVEARRFTVYFDEDIVSNTEENFTEESGEISQPRYWFQQPKRKAPDLTWPAKS